MSKYLVSAAVIYGLFTVNGTTFTAASTMFEHLNIMSIFILTCILLWFNNLSLDIVKQLLGYKS